MSDTTSRYSVRKFTEQQVEPEKLHALLQAAMQAPSSKNERPWEFLIVTDEEGKQILSQTSNWSMSAKNAPTVIVTLANLKLVEGSDLEWWPLDMAACTENILVEAVEQGLGGVWLGIYPDPKRVEHVRKHFDIPEHIVPYAMVPVGYKMREKEVQERFEPARIFAGKYGVSAE